ncbi:hypothetical protein [Roseateles sp.]|uniref:hypothetical protein n=1 Tax=Roseateles sp. TaxID=1971397 RepID=UPI002E04394F|nr:hypothetical protein [Roseateles sp.]
MNPSNTPFAAGAALLAAAALLGGCGAFERAFTGGADAIDDRSGQEAARIRLSPPQVFTREQLINDRMREDSFLQEQLGHAASAPLGSSLSRDLQVVSTLAAQLSLSVDPALKLNFQRANEQADLQQQINVTQLKSQLVVLQAQLAQLSAAGPAAAASAASPASATVGASPTLASGSTAPSDSRITALQGRIDEALKGLAAMGQTARTAGVPGTLEDEFEDRLALRSRIREEINANLLDDAHDVDGNSLYHLQFTSTVMPGPNKAQYGIARLTIEHDEAREDLDLLYHTWLAAITNRMNQNLAQRGGNGKEPLNYAVLGPMTGLYDVAMLPLSGRRQDGKPEVLQLAVHPGKRNSFAVQPAEDLRYALRSISQRLRDEARQPSGQPCLKWLLAATAASAPAVVADAMTTADDGRPRPCQLLMEPSDESFRQALREESLPLVPTPRFRAGADVLRSARGVLELAPSVEVGVHSIGDRSLIADGTKRSGKQALDQYREAFHAAKELLDRLHEACRAASPKADCARYDGQSIIREASAAPAPFKTALKQAARGPVVAFPYSADPMMRVQRLSTVASAANAVELAAGLAAQMPGSGASLGAGVGYARRASGRVDAMERVPEVIGFAGRTEDDGDYEFGWVFGPRLSVDTAGNRLLLRQQARTVPVSADVSVPGWWTRATLKVQVAWRGNFDGRGALLDAAADKTDHYALPVRFRLNRASYDALTVTLMRALTSQGYHQARIDSIRPEVLPICKDTPNARLTLLIYGVDLWRNPRVFLGGAAVPQEGVAVLPDMTGLSATVDVGTLNKQALRADGTVVVWTNHGVAEAKLRTQFKGNCEGAAGQATALTETTVATAIERVSPSQVSSCEDRLTLELSGRGLPDDWRRYRLGVLQASAVRTVESDGDVRTVAVSFDGLRKANRGLTRLALSATGSDGMVNVPIEVMEGQCAKAPEPSYSFEAGVERIAAKDDTGVLRVKLSLPAGKKPAVTLTASGGEIAEATLDKGVSLPKGMSFAFKDGAVTLASSGELKKESDTVALQLRLRNLLAGQSVVLTASPPEGNPTGKLSLTLPVGEPAGQAVAKAGR